MDLSPRNCGIAFSDEDGDFLASSFLITRDKKYNSKQGQRKMQQKIVELLNHYKPVISFIGLPLTRNLQEQKNSFFVRHFCHCIRDSLGSYYFLDERYSTNWAEASINFCYKKTTIDELVASYLLETGISLYKNNKISYNKLKV